MRNVLFIVSGPSGVGKGTIVEWLIENDPETALSISCTTRPPRTGERDGEHYFFISREEFERRIKEDDFLEYDEHFGNYYGTPRSFVEQQLKEKSVVLEIDVVGGLSVKERYPKAVLVMILPPDLAELEARLAGRKSESEEARAKRLERVKFETAQQDKYDYVLINDDLEEAKKAFAEIVKTEKNRPE